MSFHNISIVGLRSINQVPLREAVESNPNLTEVHYNLALILDKLRSHAEAKEYLRAVLELVPNNPAIRESVILKAHVQM